MVDVGVGRRPFISRRSWLDLQKPIVEARGLTKRYPGVVALDHVDFALEAGEVHVLFGENGAGKSTLISILAGASTPTSGSIEIAGEPVTVPTVRNARRPGISAVFQEFSLVPTQTVLRESRSRRRAGDCRPPAAGRGASEGGRLFAALERDIDPRQVRLAIVARRAAARRDCQGDARRLARPHLGRADRIADRSRDGDIVWTHNAPQGQRRGRHLHLPQDPRVSTDRGPDHRASGRTPSRHGACGRIVGGKLLR